jgi:threonine dehydrogenase-like Zn-dependent dehydrogenase
MIGSRRYPFGRLISHRFPLEQAEAALALVAGRGDPGERPVKVILSAG